jgi:hypothetical protein
MSLDSKFNQFDKDIEKMENGVEKELIKQYSIALKGIKAYFAELYSKHGELTYTEMQKYNRMKALEGQLKEQIRTLSGKNAKVLKTTLAEIFQHAFYTTAFTMESESQMLLAYSLLRPETIEAAVQNPVAGLTLNETLEKNRDALIIAVKAEITQGLIAGVSYKEMSKRLTNVFEGDVQKAVRVSQTESHRLHQVGRFKSLQHAQAKGIQLKKRWISTLDSKTRDRHRDLDGQIVDLDAPFKYRGVEGMYPGEMSGGGSQNINCRCSFRAVLDGDKPNVRNARGEDGKSRVIPYTNYREWEKERLKR